MVYVSKPVCIAVYTVKNPNDGQRNCPKHVEFHSKNKLEKLVRLVGLIIRMNIKCCIVPLRKIVGKFTVFDSTMTQFIYRFYEKCVEFRDL